MRLGGNIGAAVLELPPLHAGAYYVIELQLVSTRSHFEPTPRCGGVAQHHAGSPRSSRRYDRLRRRQEAHLPEQGAGDWAVIGVDDAYCAASLHRTDRARLQHVRRSHRASAAQPRCLGARRQVDRRARRAARSRGRSHEAPALAGKHNAQNAAPRFAATRALGVDHASSRRRSPRSAVCRIASSAPALSKACASSMTARPPTPTPQRKRLPSIRASTGSRAASPKRAVSKSWSRILPAHGEGLSDRPERRRFLGQRCAAKCRSPWRAISGSGGEAGLRRSRISLRASRIPSCYAFARVRVVRSVQRATKTAAISSMLFVAALSASAAERRLAMPEATK